MKRLEVLKVKETGYKRAFWTTFRKCTFCKMSRQVSDLRNELSSVCERYSSETVQRALKLLLEDYEYDEREAEARELGKETFGEYVSERASESTDDAEEFYIGLFTVAIDGNDERDCHGNMRKSMSFMFDIEPFYTIIKSGFYGSPDTFVELDIRKVLELCERMPLRAIIDRAAKRHSFDLGHETCIPSREGENRLVELRNLSYGSFMSSFINGHTIMASCEGDNSDLLRMFGRTLETYRALKQHGYRLPVPEFWNGDSGRAAGYKAEFEQLVGTR